MTEADKAKIISLWENGMTEQFHFRYKSIGNFSKLLATILYEKSHSDMEIGIWHERFDNDESDDLFESFLVELFPDGKTLQPEDIEVLMNYAERFLKKDKQAQDIRNLHIKAHNHYWVYFKPDNIVHPCEYAKHTDKIREICADFFKDFGDIDLDYLQKFILENFEINSDNSTVQSIASDARFIALYIMLKKCESEDTE